MTYIRISHECSKQINLDNKVELSSYQRILLGRVFSILEICIFLKNFKLILLNLKYVFITKIIFYNKVIICNAYNYLLKKIFFNSVIICNAYNYFVYHS